MERTKKRKPPKRKPPKRKPPKPVSAQGAEGPTPSRDSGDIIVSKARLGRSEYEAELLRLRRYQHQKEGPAREHAAQQSGFGAAARVCS